MKCLIAVAFLALVAVSFADEPAAAAPISKLEQVEPEKNEIEKDAARDKRGTILTTYTATAPIAYTSYSAPISYSAYPSLPYAYSYLRSYPSYVGYNPYNGGYILG